MDPNTNQTNGDENDLSTDNPQTQQSGVSMLTTSLNQSESASTLRVQPTMRRVHTSPPSNNEEIFQSFGNFINTEASEGDTHHYQSLHNAAAEEDPDRKSKRPNRPTRLQFSPSTRTGTIRNASYSGEPVPWSALRHYSDGTFVSSPIQVNTSQDGVYSPGGITSESGNHPPQLPMSLDDGRSLFSVIMDDGTRQRRKISLSSDHSNQTPRHSVSESVPLLGSGYDSDSEYEEDLQDAESLEGQFSYYTYSLKSWIHDKLQFSQEKKNIFKCAIAYFIASMFTFVPSLNSIVGLTDAQNSHLVATVAVFFNPAKTIGGICEAVMFAILAGLYGVFISVASMTSAVWFNTHGLYIVGHLVGVIVWCGGSMFIVAFMKATLNKPTFNSACSLANIIIFIVLTREGNVQLGVFSVDKIIQVATIVLVGISISFLVSILIWPVSASEKLKTDIGKTLESFRVLLKLLTKTFLIDDINYNDESVQSAIASHRATFISLEASFEQAKLEIHNRTMQRELPIYREVIKSLQRLAQHLGGLRSCCGLQWEMIKDKDKNGEIQLQEGESQHRPSGNFAEEEEYGDFNVLLEFIHHVGPHMKSLAYTCKQTMIHLQDQFVKPRVTSSGPPFQLLQQNLNNALSLFETSQTRAVTGLYKKQSNNGHFDGRPNEEVFLIYFFVFNLQEFTRELERLVGLVGGINKLETKDDEWRNKLEWWRLRRWVCCWPFNDADDDKILEFTKDIGASSKYDSKVEFPEHSHNLFDTIQTPKPKTKWQRLTMRLWKWFSRFRRFEVKYAFKAAVSAAILASPAFIDYTRPTFVKYRGEWACISMMVVMVPTVGGTNLMGIYRVLGTLFGSWLSFTVYSAFPDNGLVLSIIGFFVALVCFHILLYTKFNRMGQFILLTYNLVALYKFNLRNDEDDLDLWHIALYRGIAVATGVFWGVFVTSYWWPYEARTELRKGLSLLIINMSWLYKKLFGLYSVPPTNDEPTTTTSNQAQQNGETTAVTLTQSAHHHLSRSTKEFLELELFLQVSILKLYDLLAQTPNEPRLKGPFPVAAYSKILTSCQNILDKMLSMRIAVTKEQFYDAIRRDFIIPINRERHELVGNMLLYFYVLAAALRLKTPLPPYLPPAEQARRRMVKKIRDLPVVRRRIVEGDDEHYIVYYAYALVMEDIIRELEHLGAIMQELFGTMGGEDFEDFHESDQNAANQNNPEAPN